jgi:hypothetical protein
VVTVKMDWTRALDEAEGDRSIWELKERLRKAVLSDFEDSDRDFDGFVSRLCLNLKDGIQDVKRVCRLK